MEDLKRLISSILVSSTTTMTILQLNNDFRQQIGEDIPYRKYGFDTLEDFLKSMHDILHVLGTGRYAEIRLVVPEKSAHIQKLISKQKTSNGRRRRRRSPISRFQYRYRLTPSPDPMSFIQGSETPENILQPPDYVSVDSSSSEHFDVPKCSEDVPLTTTNDILRHKLSLQTETSKMQYLEISESALANWNAQNISPKSTVSPSGSSSISFKTCNNTFESTDLSIDAKGNSPSCKVPIDIQMELKTLIDGCDKGIPCSSLPEAYQDMYSKSLQFMSYGYGSFLQMFMDLDNIFSWRRSTSGTYKGEFVLYSRSREAENITEPVVVGADSTKVGTKPAVVDAGPAVVVAEPAVVGVEDLIDDHEEQCLYPPKVIQLYEEIKREFLADGMTENSYIDVMIAEVYDPSKFWLILRHSYKQLDVLMDKLQEFYNCTETLNYYNIPSQMVKIGLYCVAQYYGEYHRVVIVNLMSHHMQKVKVYFIDYGTVSAVNMLELYYLHKKFTELPQFAIRARLAGIYPRKVHSQWSLASANRFLQLVKEKMLVAQLTHIDWQNQIVEVILADTSGDNDVFINDTLVNEKHAYFINQEQDKNVLDRNSIPLVKYLHLYPTFNEIEQGIVPTAQEVARLTKVGVPLEVMYSHYFVKANDKEEHKDEKSLEQTNTQVSDSALSPSLCHLNDTDVATSEIKQTEEVNVFKEDHVETLTNLDITVRTSNEDAETVNEKTTEVAIKNNSKEEQSNIEIISYNCSTSSVGENSPRNVEESNVPNIEQPKLQFTRRHVKPPPGFENFRSRTVYYNAPPANCNNIIPYNWNGFNNMNLECGRYFHQWGDPFYNNIQSNSIAYPMPYNQYVPNPQVPYNNEIPFVPMMPFMSSMHLLNEQARVYNQNYCNPPNNQYQQRPDANNSSVPQKETPLIRECLEYVIHKQLVNRNEFVLNYFKDILKTTTSLSEKDKPLSGILLQMLTNKPFQFPAEKLNAMFSEILKFLSDAEIEELSKKVQECASKSENSSCNIPQTESLSSSLGKLDLNSSKIQSNECVDAHVNGNKYKTCDNVNLNNPETKPNDCVNEILNNESQAPSAVEQKNMEHLSNSPIKSNDCVKETLSSHDLQGSDDVPLESKKILNNHEIESANCVNDTLNGNELKSCDGTKLENKKYLNYSGTDPSETRLNNTEPEARDDVSLQSNEKACFKRFIIQENFNDHLINIIRFKDDYHIIITDIIHFTSKALPQNALRKAMVMANGISIPTVSLKLNEHKDLMEDLLRIILVDKYSTLTLLPLTFVPKLLKIFKFEDISPTKFDDFLKRVNDNKKWYRETSL